jgi:hypothetical protein
MKYLKMLGLAMGVASLMAFMGAGSASATVLCKVASSPCPVESRYGAGTTVHASLEAGRSLIFEGGSTVIDTCTSATIQGKSANTGSATESVFLKSEAFSIVNCTTTSDLTTLGEMQIHWISGSNNGTLTAKGTSGVAAGCSWNLKEWTAIGTIKGGNPASIEVTMPNSQICWWNRMTAIYTITSPKPLYVSGS